MSSATAQPEALAAAIARLAGFAPALTAKNIAAAAPTAGMVPAAADDVSAMMAAQFAIHAQFYQVVSAQMCQALSAQAAAAIGAVLSTSTDSDDSDAATEGADDSPALKGCRCWILGCCRRRSTRPACIPALGRDRCWLPQRPGCVGRQLPRPPSVQVCYRRPDHWAMVGAVVGSDGHAATPTSRGCTILPPSRAQCRPGRTSRRRLRAGLCDNGAATGDRRQPQPVDDVDRHEFFRPEHAGHRSHRDVLRGNVGARRGDYVRLRWILLGCNHIDAVQRPPSTTNSVGLATQSAAAAHAATSSGGSSSTTLSQLISDMPTALAQLAVPARRQTRY